MPLFGMPDANIVELRKFLAERFPQERLVNVHLNTGLDFLDQATGGGFPKGAITELITPHMSAGSASLIHALVQAADRDRYFVALIDGVDCFDPQSLDGDSLRHLLWVRCHKACETIKAADLLLRDGNFSLVILDLVLNAPAELRKIPQTSWYRLQRLVESVPTAFLVLSHQSMVSSAQLKLILDNSWRLQTLEEDSALSQLQFRVQRSHLKAEIKDQISEVS